MTEDKFLEFRAPRTEKCRGLCQGERSATDGPAVWGKLSNGKKILYCPCCDTQLTYTPVDFSTGAPNVKPGLVSKQYRFEDSNCQYDQVVLVGIK